MKPRLSGEQLKPASLPIRAIAAIFDSVAAWFAWYYIIELWGIPKSSAGGFTSVTMGAARAMAGFPALALIIATAAFWIIPEWATGATLGKWVCKLRVVSREGSPITIGQSLKRNTLRLIDCFPFYLIGFLVAALTPERQRLGDLWAKTIVV
jgi:uncharacterized RDD family membrane protein YckC